MAALYLQLTGRELGASLTTDEKDAMLETAAEGQSVLLVLDDVWDRDDCARCAQLLDPATESKVLISTRVRAVLEGGADPDIHEIAVPSEADAIAMLLVAGGIDPDAGDDVPDEAAEVARFCRRLPLVLGIAGKLIRQMPSGGRGRHRGRPTACSTTRWRGSAACSRCATSASRSPNWSHV